MSFNAAALRLMADKGLSLDDVVEIAAANEKRADTTATERKRRQRQREREEAEALSQRDVTRDIGSPNESILTLPVTPTNSNELASPPQNLNGEKKPDATPDQFIEAWNAMANESGVHRVGKLTPDRRKKINTLLRRHGIDDITEAIWAVPQSPFCCGQNDRGWKADLEFFLKPATVPKLIEGSYG